MKMRFVGGFHAGCILDVPDDRQEWQLVVNEKTLPPVSWINDEADLPPDGECVVTTETYRRRKFAKNLFLMAQWNMKPEEIMQELLDNYHPREGRCDQ